MGPSPPRGNQISERTTYIVASGHAHPERVVTSDGLARTVPGLEVGWSEARLGITERRMAASHEHIAGFAVSALRQALEHVGWSGSDLDAIICGTSFVDDLLPATASMIARDVSPSALAFDVNAACASVPYTLVLAESLLMTHDDIERIAVCVAERPTAWANYEDRDSCVFWGDSAGCVLLQRGGDTGLRLAATALKNDSTFAEKVRVRRGGHFQHDGRYSRGQVIDLTEATCKQVLASEGIDPASVRVFVGHQSNIPLLRDIGERLGVPWDRQWHNVEWAGNQGGAGVLTALSAGLHANPGKLRRGDYVLVAAVGGGYSAGAVLLEWRG